MNILLWGLLGSVDYWCTSCFLGIYALISHLQSENYHFSCFLRWLHNVNCFAIEPVFPRQTIFEKKNLHSIGSKIRNRWWPCSYCDFGFVLFWIRVSRMCFLIFFWCRNVEKLETHLHLMWNFGLKWIRSFVEGIFIIKSGSESELLTSEKP